MPLNEHDLRLLTTVKSNDVNAVKALLSDKKDEKDSKAITAHINCAFPHDDKELPCCTPLHIAVHNCNPDMVKLLLEHGAKTYFVDKDFKTAIQRATDVRRITDTKKAEKIENILLYFLRHRASVDLNHVTSMLATVRGLYVKPDEKIDRQALVDYAASCLAGVNVDSLLRQDGNYQKYLSHLKRYKGSSLAYSNDGKLEETDLESWRSEKFLPLRIRSFIKIILEIDNGYLPDLAPDELRKLKDRKTMQAFLDAIYQELSVSLNTLHICYALDAICNFSLERKAIAESELAQNISRQLEDDKSFSEGQEFSFPGGWYKHAVYVNFVKSKDTRLFVRIDNLGGGCNVVYRLIEKRIELGEETWNDEKRVINVKNTVFNNVRNLHRGDPGEWQRLHAIPAGHIRHRTKQACVLGIFNLATANLDDAKNEKGAILQYIEDIIAERVRGDTTQKPIINDPKLSKKENERLAKEADERLYQSIKDKALFKVYNFTYLIPQRLIKDTVDGPELPFQTAQTVGNCSVENYQAGLETRMRRIGWNKAQRDWLLNEEIKIASLNPVKEPIDISRVKSSLIELPPIPRPDSMEAAISEYYKEEKQAQVKRLFSDEMMPVDKCYINLSFITDHRRRELEHKMHGFDIKNDRKNSNTRDEYLSLSDEVFGYNPQGTAELSNIFLGGQECRVLITGRAGIGKSTFCQYTAHQWAIGKLLPQNNFDLVIWIRLRNLNNLKFYPSGHHYSYLDIVRKECHALLGYEMPNELLEQQLKSHKVLWLLDGYDELPQALLDHSENSLEENANEKGTLKTAVKELFAKPKYLIVTSRPNIIPLNGGYKHLELVGFTDVNIREYINQFFLQNVLPTAPFYERTIFGFFDIKSDEKAPQNGKADPLPKKLVTRLQFSPNLASLAHIPLLLELMCCLWQSNSASLNTISAMTTLYRESLRWLLQRTIEKNKISTNGKIPELYYEKELIALEMLAFKADGKPILDAKLIYEVLSLIYPPQEEKVSFLQQLWNTGFLRTLPGSKNLLERNGEFLHLTFQEFFAARHVLRQLQNSAQPDYQKALQWVVHHKYRNQNIILISFLAGLLSETENVSEAVRADFWKALHAPPRDLIGIRHLQMIIRCLEEASGDLSIPYQKTWEDNIQLCFTTNLPQQDPIAESIIQQLVHIFKQSPKVFHRVVERSLCDALKDRTKQLSALKVIIQLESLAATPNILQAFKDLIIHDNPSIKNSAFYALSRIEHIGDEIAKHIDKALPSIKDVIETLRSKREKDKYKSAGLVIPAFVVGLLKLITMDVVSIPSHGLMVWNHFKVLDSIITNLEILAGDNNILNRRVAAIGLCNISLFPFFDFRLLFLPFDKQAFHLLQTIYSTYHKELLMIFTRIAILDADPGVKGCIKEALMLLSRSPATFQRFKVSINDLTDTLSNQTIKNKKEDLERIKRWYSSDVTEHEVTQALVCDDVEKRDSAIRILYHRNYSSPKTLHVIANVIADQKNPNRKDAILLVANLGHKALIPKMQKVLISALKDSEKDTRYRAASLICQLFPITETFLDMLDVMKDFNMQDIANEFLIGSENPELKEAKKIVIWTHALLLQSIAITITQQHVCIYDALGTECINFKLDEGAVRYFLGTIIKVFESHAKQYGLPTDIYAEYLNKLEPPVLPNTSLLRGVTFDRVDERTEFFTEIRHDEKQLGWNCFDVAVGLTNIIETKEEDIKKRAQLARKQLVDFALGKSDQVEFRRLLAPEVRHAAALTAVYLNLKQPKDKNNFDEKTNARIIELFNIADALQDKGEKNSVIQHAMKLLEQGDSKSEATQNELSRHVLPECLQTEALRVMVNNYNDAHEVMRPIAAACNRDLGALEGKPRSLEQLDNFFADEKNCVRYKDSAANYKNQREKLRGCEEKLQSFCESQDTYKKYIEHYYGNNSWVAFQRGFAGERANTSMVDIAARLLKAQIIIYQRIGNDREEIYRTLPVCDKKISIQFSYGHFIGLGENPVYVKGLADNLRSLGIFSLTSNAGIIDEKVTISPLIQASFLKAKVQVDATSETALSIVKQFLY